MKEKKQRFCVMLFLNLLLMLYSLTGIFSKLAAQTVFFSGKFIIYYGLFLGVLVLYALGWQQIIKRMPLSLAYANKAVTIIWGMIWGKTFFNEKITLNNMVGAIVVIIGVIIYTQSDDGGERNVK